MNKLFLVSIIVGIFLAPMSPHIFYKGIRESDIIAQSKHPEELMAIYTLESSQGKNDGCKRKGKFNGFGFRQNSREFKCYDSFQEVVSEVDAWLTQKDLRNYCMYNEGINRADCPYAKNMQFLLN